MRTRQLLFSIVLLAASIGQTFSKVHAQITLPQTLLQKAWKARWIAVSGEDAKAYGVYNFRKEINLPTKPTSFVVHVSADNRYKLFVNGILVSLGPARGDLTHWNFESVDLAPYLRSGKNVVAALVWNEGAYKPEAQISYRTGFILQGNSAAEDSAITNESWKAIRDSSYQPLQPQLVYSYYVAGPGEEVDMRRHSDAWMTLGFNDSGWKNAQPLLPGVPKGVFEWAEGSWMLVPRTIPQMELTAQRFQAVRSATGISVPTNFPLQKSTLTVPANTKATLLLDQGYLTNAYPTLLFNGGENATVTIGYAEALYINEGSEKDWRAQTAKGNRNDVEGKRFVGRDDRVRSNGKAGQAYTPLWWRTFRYVQLQIKTGATPLTITDFFSTFTGYPFALQASLTTSDTLFKNIMAVGWRTARLCAVETYMDCPYYEQLQYVGDTRIQALVSLYNSGDDRLMRQAITQLDNSRMAEGITLSRYPTANTQQIPPFSLWWIGMLHDYWMYRPDAEFVRQKLAGVRQVLLFFSRYQQADGSLKNTPYWNFTDWATGKGWDRGMAPVGTESESAVLDLQLLWAYQTAAKLETALSMPAYAQQYKNAAQKLTQTVVKKYWNKTSGLFADTRQHTSYSQHVNALALLTGVVTGTEATAVAQKLLTDTALTQATIYFKYYLHQALIKSGLGNDYMNWLGDWKQNLEMGMTTWAEISDINKTRSDCHAWGAHPNIEFFRTVLGIDSDAPGFKTVKIEPHLGKLKEASGQMPHPAGIIAVKYKLQNQKLQATITLPKNTAGNFVWKGKRYALKNGQSTKLAL